MTTATRAETSWGRFRADFQAELLTRIPEHLGRLSWSAGQIESAQRDGLRRLLAHAVAHSPFHRQRLAGTDVASIEPADLASLPVMTKTDMMASIDDVFTDRRLTLGALEQALAATGSEPIPVPGRYMALATGGSTGQRGVFVFDPAAKAEFILSIIRSLQAPCLIGFASALARPAAEQRAHRLHIAPSVIISTSETLLPEARAEITAAFGTPVINSFASTEGLMG